MTNVIRHYHKPLIYSLILCISYEYIRFIHPLIVLVMNSDKSFLLFPQDWAIALGHLINPAEQFYLHFGLFSVPTMSCTVCWKLHIKDPLLLIRKSSLCGDRGFPLKKYVTMNIRLMFNCRLYEKQYVLEMSLNKTNFPL